MKFATSRTVDNPLSSASPFHSDKQTNGYVDPGGRWRVICHAADSGAAPRHVIAGSTMGALKVPVSRSI
jgi:hypothetical protein